MGKTIDYGMVDQSGPKKRKLGIHRLETKRRDKPPPRYIGRRKCPRRHGDAEAGGSCLKHVGIVFELAILR